MLYGIWKPLPISWYKENTVSDEKFLELNRHDPTKGCQARTYLRNMEAALRISVQVESLPNARNTLS